jgi:3-oxoacyl-[acyl-carrier protein] reductase
MHKGRVVVITGGGSGIGQATAAAFAQMGDQVVIIGRTESKLQTSAQKLGENVVWQRADVSIKEQVAEVVARIIEQFGHIDVLINNAGFVLGVTTDMSLVEAERAWDAVLDTNLKGGFLMTVAVSPHMPRPGGRIIYVSSIAAYTGGSRAGSTAYAAAKAGVLGMTHGFARELSSQGITVNAVNPGFIANTEFTGGWSESRVKGIVSEIPVGRGGVASDVAYAICYLASPEASFVTGEILNVNGGWRFGM